MGTLTVTGLPPALESAVRSRLGEPELDVVVAGPGRQAVGPFLELDQERWERAVAGVSSAFFEAQRVVGELLAAGRPGRVVFVLSTTAVRPVHGASLDATVGGFLTAITQVGAAELGAAGITVNAVAHGWFEGDDPAQLVDGIPVGRLASADDVARAVAFLASADAAYVNGALLAVDGGFWITKTAGGSPLTGHG